jgi:hypothetical protein
MGHCGVGEFLIFFFTFYFKWFLFFFSSPLDHKLSKILKEILFKKKVQNKIFLDKRDGSNFGKFYYLIKNSEP